MPKKKEKDIFQRIEEAYGPIPTCLKEILRNSGFDNGLSIELLNEKAIEDIESYIQENGESVISTLQCCSSDIYKNQIAKNVFAFTPGHKYTILAIAEKARGMHQIEIDRSNKNRKEPVIEPTTTSVIVDPEKESKHLLIKKLKEAMGKAPNVTGVELKIDESIVVELEIQMIGNKANGSGKCVCSQCGSFIQATCVNGNWRAHNVLRHFRNHFGQKNSAPSNVAESTNDDRWQSPIENSTTVHSAEGTSNQNEETGKTTDLEVLKEFDPLYSCL